MPIKAQQNESGLSQHEQGSLTSMSDRLLGTNAIFVKTPHLIFRWLTNTLSICLGVD